MYEYTAKLVRVVDGDTVDLDIDLGLETRRLIRVRFEGINTDELHDPDPDKRERAKQAKAFVESALTTAVGDGLVVKTFKDRTEKYGRYLVELFVFGDFISVNQKLLDAGLAVSYHGEKR